MSTYTTLRSAIRRSSLISAALILLVSGCASMPEELPADPPLTQDQPSIIEAAPEVEPENPGFDQTALDDLLRTAAWANDIESAERLISWGADVNAKDDTQQSAYLISTSEGHLEFLQLTLAHGADVHSLDSWNGTGLIRAAERGHWAVVGELIRADTPLDHVNRVGYQAIHEDVWMGRDDATYFATTYILFAGGADFTTASMNEGLTPLQMAEYRGFAGQVAVIQGVLNEPVPADPSAALLVAAEAGNPAAVAAALRAGADGNAVRADGMTAFELAKTGSHILSAQILSALGYDGQ